MQRRIVMSVMATMILVMSATFCFAGVDEVMVPYKYEMRDSLGNEYELSVMTLRVESNGDMYSIIQGIFFPAGGGKPRQLVGSSEVSFVKGHGVASLYIMCARPGCKNATVYSEFNSHSAGYFRYDGEKEKAVTFYQIN